MKIAMLCATLLILCCKPGDPDIKILDGRFSAVNDLFNHPALKNKVVYVDLWGTRCIPCIEEFAFNEALKKNFEGKPVEYLYLALDYPLPNGKKEWARMINEKNLKGYNVFISGEMYMQIWDSIKDSVETMHLIPHYLILDKEGNVAYADAARPSSKEVLYNQIETVLQDKN